ncbi:MAG: sensor histidine kinase [Gemmatimonadetes bacterium]|nr:sensor histidine kinase [Gemmatimonadota bacterium]
MPAESRKTFQPAIGRRLADRIEAGKDAIVNAWAGAVRHDPLIPSSERLDQAALVDHIPKILRELCHQLRGTSHAAAVPAIREDARTHGALRFLQGYDLAEVMREFAHLRLVLLDTVIGQSRGEGAGGDELSALVRTITRTADESGLSTILTYVSRAESATEQGVELSRRHREITDREILDRNLLLQQELLEQERSRVEALESAAIAKDEFLAMLSHELRTPLTPILAWITILERNSAPDTVQNAVATIGRNGRVLAQLIDDLLDVSRMVAGKLDLSRDLHDAGAVVRAAVETVLPQGTAKGVTVAIDDGQDPLPVLGDPTRLQQVIWNLLSNAVKFSPPGGEVRVRTALVNGEVLVTVADDGVGIAPGFLPHVFGRFRQQDESSTRGHGGLGLGLAIAQAITQAHGGRLTAYSEGEGHGSTFELALPCASDAWP